jgi:hypothetical protein
MGSTKCATARTIFLHDIAPIGFDTQISEAVTTLGRQEDHSQERCARVPTSPRTV